MKMKVKNISSLILTLALVLALLSVTALAADPTAVTLSGISKPGRVLTATVEPADAGISHFEWSRSADGTTYEVIPDAGGGTYAITDEDIGYRVKVTVRNVYGQNPVDSEPTDVITAPVTFTANGIIYEVLIDNGNGTGTAEVYKNPSAAGAVAIPSSVIDNGVTYTVTSIGYQAFYGRPVSSVTIPGSVTAIGEMAFVATGLSAITIPSSVTSFGDSVFVNSSSLAAVYFEGNAPTLGGDVFRGNSESLKLYYRQGATGFDAIYASYSSALTLAVQYAVIVDSGISGGAVEALPAYAELGQTVNLIVTPDTDKELESLTYNDGTDDYDITGGSFTMPDSAVTVTATFIDTAAKTPVSISETPQNFTYNGSPLAFVISGTPSAGFAITYNQGTGNVTPVNPGSYNVVITRAEDATYAAFSLTIPNGLVINPVTVSISAIGGVTAPVTGRIPVSTATETEQYTGTVTWEPAVTGTFAASIEYTATITLTPKTGYTLTGVTADFFTITGATSDNNDVDSGVITAVFLATGAASSGGGGGGGNSPSKATNKGVTAEVTAGGGTDSFLSVTIDTNSGTASVDIGSASLSQDRTTITIPSIPDVDTYKVGILVPELTTEEEQGSLTLDTDAGSVAVPSNMLTGVEGVSGSKAEITIGQGDKSTLPDDVKAAIGDKPLIQLTLSIDGKQTDWSNPNAAVTVSIPYKPTADELKNPDSIVIWYIDSSGKTVSIPNGHYDPVNGTVTFSTTHFSYYAISFKQVSFKDVAKDAWYAKAVSFIAAREITTGTSKGNFSPEAKLTRGQFIVMLMKAYGIAPHTNPKDNFADAGNTYYTGYLAAAKRLGISSGIGNNQYAPDKEITRQEMFTLLYNALKVIEQLPGGDSGKTLSDFSDAGQIDTWAEEAMTLLVKTGTVDGSNGKLTPIGTTIRAEMAQVLYNLLGK